MTTSEQTMSEESVLPAETLAAFDGDELRARIFLEKYALRGPDDQILETRPEQMWDRVARELASAEADPERGRWEREFRWLLGDFRFLPGGRIMHGAGNPRKVTLINCFVESIQQDSIEGIYETATHAARTYSRGGGIGIDISPLRPAGSPVHNAARHSTGAVSFMELFSLTTGLIGQSGRRGALMLTIADHHPDVLDFCRIKRNLTSVRFANISVRLSDAFMRAVRDDGPWTLWFDSPMTGRIERTIGASELWHELTTGARDWAEPGCLFWDTTKRMGTSEYNGMEVISTNPCGEQPLGHGDCCDLGSINLATFVLDPFTPGARVNWDELRRAARIAVRFLDDVHEYSFVHGLYPLPHQEAAARCGRRVGVGILGLGDMLVKLGLRYDTDDAIRAAGEVMEAIKVHAYAASADLAADKGPFQAWDADKHLAQAFYHTFLESLLNKIRRTGLRNVSVLTIPPVGSGAALAGVTNGLEPIFALSYVRRSESLSQEFFHVLHPLVRDYLRAHGQGISADELARSADPHAYLESRLPEEFVSAHEIDPLKRVDMQAALQQHIDQSISSTVNLPREATTEVVSQVYFHAWQAGLKGISVYVEGSREGVLLTPEEAKRRHQLVALADRVTAVARETAPSITDLDGRAPEQQIEHVVRAPEQQIEHVVRALAELTKERPEQLELIAQPTGPMRDRPQALQGATYRIPMDRLGTLFVTVNDLEDEPFEVFCRLGKAGADTEADAEALGRLLSFSLRIHGPVPRRVRLEALAEQLQGIGGSISIGFGPNRVRSIADGVSQALRRHLERSSEEIKATTITASAAAIAAPRSEAEAAPIAGGSNGLFCPRCQRYTLVTKQGCAKCECGFKEC